MKLKKRKLIQMFFSTGSVCFDLLMLLQTSNAPFKKSVYVANKNRVQFIILVTECWAFKKKQLNVLYQDLFGQGEGSGRSKRLLFVGKGDFDSKSLRLRRHLLLQDVRVIRDGQNNLWTKILILF